MRIFCTKCHAVYFGELPLDGCDNLLCDGETLVINDANFALLQAMIDGCCHLLIKQHVNLLGSVYFLEIGFVFCSAEKAQEFFEKAESIIDQIENSDKIFVDMDESPGDHHVVTIEYLGGYEDLMYLDDMEKVQAVFKFKEALRKIFIPGTADETTPASDLKSA